MSHEELEVACQIVAAKDTTPLRRALFVRLSERALAVRAAAATWDHLGSTRQRAAFVSALAVQSFLEVRFPTSDADIVSVWKYDNERRQLDALGALAERVRIAPITLEPRNALTRLGTREPSTVAPRLAAGFSLLRTHASRGDFLVAARVASTVGYYQRMLPWLARSRASAVLVSSDTNPYAMALVAAARRLGKKTCFVTHGHVAEGPPALRFDLALLDGPAVLEVYGRAGPVTAEVVFKGSEGRVRSMNTSGLSATSGTVATVGVLSSILSDPRRVGKILGRLEETRSPRRIVLRLHPNRTMRDPRWSTEVNVDSVEVSEGKRPLTEDADGCDLIVAGNTSAHLTALKWGVPTVYLPGLDEAGEDYYGFVERGVVPAFPSPEALDVDAIARFYDAPDWAVRFARFDAGYPDRQAACDEAVREALTRLIARAR